jgi:hypothetical protein
MNIDGMLVFGYPDEVVDGSGVVNDDIMPADGMGLDDAHWKRVESAARAAIRTGITALRVNLEGRNPFDSREQIHSPAYPRRRPSSVKRQMEDAELLMRCLYYKRDLSGPAHRMNRQRLAKLCDLVGLRRPSEVA